MLHFTPEAEPKFETHRHPLLEQFSRALGDKALGLAFEPARVESDELLQSINDEIAARRMTIEELQERPDLDAINQFLDGALADFRRDGIDYAEE